MNNTKVQTKLTTVQDIGGGESINIKVLGTKYDIKTVSYNDDPLFVKNDMDGYCDILNKIIVLCDYSTHPGWKDATPEEQELVRIHLLRHEIIHAFLAESGLQNQTHNGWAADEEIVDWIAVQFPKILSAFKKSECI